MSPKDTKLTFSPSELDFLGNKKVIDLKSSILDRIELRLGQIRLNLLQNSQNWAISSSLLENRGKITRGENHLGYPWRILDFPSNFSGLDSFSLRHLFWWGNHCSVTLHIANQRSTKFINDDFQKLLEIIAKPQNNFLIGSTRNMWSNKITDHIDIASINNPTKYINDFYTNNKFIRITRILDLDRINELESFCIETAELLFNPNYSIKHR